MVNAIEELRTTQMNIQIKYFVDGLDEIQKIENGDWIDLRCAEDVELKAGEFKYIRLGVGMKLPEGYEAHVAARSSTFKNFNIILANGVGIIDSSYCGEHDEWMFPAIALADTKIAKNDRICQFRIMPKQPSVVFATVEHLDPNSRGGLGSTGTK